MDSTDDTSTPDGRTIYETSLSGAQKRPFIPPLRSDHSNYTPIPHSLAEFRNQEGREARKKKLHALWSQLPKPTSHRLDAEGYSNIALVNENEALTLQKAQKLKAMYENELLGRCGVHLVGPAPGHIKWKDFKTYAEAKEVGTLLSLLLVAITNAYLQSCGRFSTMNLTWMVMVTSMLMS